MCDPEGALFGSVLKVADVGSARQKDRRRFRKEGSAHAGSSTLYVYGC